MFAFASPRRQRRPSLTPMIDVVFLLLVFFMLAARFGMDASLPLILGGGGGDWQGPPRLVEVLPDGLRLNGRAVTAGDLPAALEPLMPTADAPVLVRADNGADLGRLVAVIDLLRGAGVSRPVVVE